MSLVQQQGDAGVHDPVTLVREAVDHALGQLLNTETSSPEQDQVVAQAFLAVLTPALRTELAARAEQAGGPLARVVTALETAVDLIAAGRVEDARGELVIARGALVALAPPVQAAPAAEVCDLCEERAPQWLYPTSGDRTLPGVGGVLAGLADTGWLACQFCRETLDSADTEQDFAVALGFTDGLLPRSVRGLFAQRGAVRPFPPPDR